jgi:hypothetical protein
MDMEPSLGINIKMSGEMEENSPTSPLYPDLHNEISGGALSGAGSHTGGSLIYRRELSRPMNSQA